VGGHVSKFHGPDPGLVIRTRLMLLMPAKRTRTREETTRTDHSKQV
jgi:hypothetical protein